MLCFARRAKEPFRFLFFVEDTDAKKSRPRATGERQIARVGRGFLASCCFVSQQDFNGRHCHDALDSLAADTQCKGVGLLHVVWLPWRQRITRRSEAIGMPLFLHQGAHGVAPVM